MAYIDSLFVVKTKTGEAIRVGDVGKTVVRDLPPDATEDTLEPYFFYSKEHKGVSSLSLGEVNNIQVEPSWSGNEAQLDGGDAIVYGSDDLLD